MAQVRGGDNFYAQRCVIDLNFPIGLLMQTPTNMMDANYPNAINTNIDKIKMSTGTSYGVDANFGYFVGHRRRFGIGAGIMYQSQSSEATIGAFHVEYKATDSKDNVYRQMVTATHPIKEEMTITNISIPVVLKFKQRLNTRIGISVDAGILYNVQIQNKWKTDAEFNYEAIYKFSRDGSGATVTVYDDASVPNVNDWLITKAQYEKHNTMGTVPGVFDSLRSRGYNVALGVKPTNNSGTVNYTTGSIGFILRPTVNVRMTNRIHLNLGAYITYQTFENKTMSNYRLVDNMGGTYSSMLNTVSSSTNTSFGLNLGVRYFLGTPKDAQFDGKFDN
jgi:hypothetical protein